MIEVINIKHLMYNLMEIVPEVIIPRLHVQVICIAAPVCETKKNVKHMCVTKSRDMLYKS